MSISRKTDAEALFQRFPHLRAIDEEWGTRGCRMRLMKLMNDTRGGSRAGFPAEHARTIMLLLLEHDRLYPQYEEDAALPMWGEDHLRRYGR
ncbi:hypothetical protein [Azoarcus sp. DD4]|uniref:hypothetical protein n=1 Tax=Azoarcus sp. DD4 TaxID=2027405 RepID=UPI001F0EDD35|nr:hypothetical protein [Azoarcus sp. DD4]